MYCTCIEYLYSGGVDVSYLCQDQNCRSVTAELHYGHDFQHHFSTLLNSTIFKVQTFFEHFARAARWQQCEFLVYIESDIWMQRAFIEEDRPKGDVGGIWNPWYPTFNKVNNNPL